MRTTNNMLVNNMIYYMNNNLDRMQKYQDQLATGKKIMVPSDDPVIAARALKFRTDVAEVTQLKTNTKDAKSWMDTTESALGQLNDILQLAYEKAVDAKNGTKTTDDRNKIRDEIMQLKHQVISISNTSYAGRYIFSGFSTDKKLMNEDGTYNCTVSSSSTKAIKGGLLDLKPGNAVDTGVSNSFNISLDGTNYYNVTLTSGIVYDGTAGKTLDDLAKDIQQALQSATPIGAAGQLPPQMKEIRVTNEEGRLVFSLNDPTDANGNYLNIFLRQSASNDLLDRINIRTEGAPGLVVSRNEDIKYQVGIGDLLNVNVAGTDLFGTGIKGETGDLIARFNRFIDALSFDDKSRYISGGPITASASSPLDFSGGAFTFDIDIDGTFNTTIAIPAVK